MDQSPRSSQVDPGWKPAIQGVWRLLLPGRARSIAQKASALITTRTFAAGAVMQWLFFGGLLALLDHDLHLTSAALAVAVFGAVALLLIAGLRRRDLSTNDPKQIRAEFMKSFFIGFAFSNASVVFGFIGFFVAARGRLMTYLAGILFGIVGLGTSSPTRARLEQLQQQLRAAGSSLSIVEVLNAPPEPPKPHAPRKR